MSNRTITLITPVWSEKEQTQHWRPIADRWPAFSSPPSVQGLSLDEALTDPSQVAGWAAMLLPDADTSRAAVLRLIDSLQQRMIPVALLTPTNNEAFSSIADQDVLSALEDEDPAVLAAALDGLMRRQPAVESLLSEVGAVRRTQSGLRDQIDRVHEELQLAASVQKEFVPQQPPLTPGLDIGVLFRPCGYVSGDIYDIVRIDERRTGFFVADAVGHGVPAALMTMVLTRAVRDAEAQHRAAEPAEVMRRLNDTLLKRNRATHMFATAVYVVVDSRRMHVSVAGAGHPPPLRLRDDEAEKIETSGGLLGVFADGEYDQREFVIEPDETLLVYSDGFETAFPGAGADGYGRRLPTTHYLEHFAALRQDGRADGLGEAMRRLGRSLDAQAGSLHQVDDLTALAIAPGAQAGEAAVPDPVAAEAA